MGSQVYGVRLLGQPRFRAAAIGMLVVIAVAFRAIQLADLTTRPQWGYDLSFYWTAAQHLLHGEPIYSATQLSGPYAPQGQDGFLYPPPFAALMIPLAALTPSPQVAEWIWTSLGLVILVAGVLALARSERLDERFPILRGNGRWLLVGAAFAFAPVIGELSIGNVHLLLFALLTVAWLGIRRSSAGGDLVAGFALGAAAVIKVFPGLLLLWLVATRRFRAAAAMVGGAVGLAVITMPLTGLEPWRQFPTVLANLSAVYDTTDTISPTIWLTPVIGFGVARWLVAAVGIVIVALAALRDRDAGAQQTSYAIAVVASVLIAPNVFHHYLAIFVLPLLLALGAGVRLRWLVLAYLLMSGGQQSSLGDLAWIVNRVLPTVGALVLLAALVGSAPHRNRPQPHLSAAPA